MPWNWQHENWPNFIYEDKDLREEEDRFLIEAGRFAGAYRHIRSDDQNTLTIDLLETEAYRTSEIEGELLNRDSIRSSLRRNLGLLPGRSGEGPREVGIASMMTDLYLHFNRPLAEEELNQWHLMVTNGRTDLTAVGRYRDHKDAMQVVSGMGDRLTVHYEAPPSERVPSEMERFIQWFNATAPGGPTPLPALTRSGLAHLYFVSIHPYEDGNGRIARAIAEKALYQGVGQATLITMSHVIQRTKKEYYAQLEATQSGLSVEDWLMYSARSVRAGQKHAQSLVEFTLEKGQIFNAARDKGVNDRQRKALERLFKSGIDGFTGGLSADNYMKITGAARATATRDLKDMVSKQLLVQTGELKTTRYWLNISSHRDKAKSPEQGPPRPLKGYIAAVRQAKKEGSSLALQIAEARLTIAEKYYFDGDLKVPGALHQEIVEQADRVVQQRLQGDVERAPADGQPTENKTVEQLSLIDRPREPDLDI